MKRLLAPKNPYLRDGILAVAALAVILVLITVAMSTVWFPVRPIEYVEAAVVATAAWPISRRFPRATLLVISVIVTSPLYGEFIQPEVRTAGFAIAAFRAAQLGARKRFVIPVVVVVAPVAISPNLAALLPYRDPIADMRAGVSWIDPSVDIMQAIVIATIVVLGFAVHRQQQIAADLHAKNIELVALRALDRDRVSAEVRSEIARDLHDVVAHHVTAMVVSAQAADRVADRDPSVLRDTVRAIAAEGDDALEAMRRVVRVLRSGPADGRDMQNFATALDDMLGRLTASGHRASVSGEIVGATEFVENIVLRIVQESLTNVMLHSDATEITVRFTTAGDSVELLVEDDGTRVSASSSALGGNGIPGMRERAAAVGGAVTAGPRPDGGWAVRATLPLLGHLVPA